MPDLNDKIPAEIKNLKELFREDDGLTHEEFLQLQESVHRSLQENPRKEGEPSRRESAESQLARDEALARALLDEDLARALQELGDDFGPISLYEHSAAESTGLIRTETPVRARRQDDIDPDNMTYEELQSLAETVGTENRGLSDELISRLTTFKYEERKFPTKEKKKCVICYMPYNSGECLKALPCAHIYHSKCIKLWLKLRKQCPVCLMEVRLD